MSSERTAEQSEMRVRLAVVELESAAPYSQGKPITSKKRDNEPHDDFEQRTWRERIHCDDKGQVFIPPTALKNCLSEAAKFLSMSVPGKGKATFTKHFEAGVQVSDPIMLAGVTAESIVGERLFVPADGRRGGGKRVWKVFPTVPKWAATATVVLLDETITEAVFLAHLRAAGRFIGMGRFRPRNNGFYGRFIVKSVKWEEVS